MRRSHDRRRNHLMVGGSARLHNNIGNQHRLDVIISTVQCYANYRMNIKWHLTIVKFMSQAQGNGLCYSLFSFFFSLQTKHFFTIQPKHFSSFSRYISIYCQRPFAHLHSDIVRVSLRSSTSTFIFHVLPMVLCNADQFCRQLYTLVQTQFVQY